MNTVAKFRPTTADTVVTDLRAFASFLERANEHDRRCAAGDLNNILDEWRILDSFGTEGQLDPRGDHRE